MYHFLLSIFFKKKKKKINIRMSLIKIITHIFLLMKYTSYIYNVANIIITVEKKSFKTKIFIYDREKFEIVPIKSTECTLYAIHGTC